MVHADEEVIVLQIPHAPLDLGFQIQPSLVLLHLLAEGIQPRVLPVDVEIDLVGGGDKIEMLRGGRQGQSGVVVEGGGVQPVGQQDPALGLVQTEKAVLLVQLDAVGLLGKLVGGIAPQADGAAHLHQGIRHVGQGHGHVHVGLGIHRCAVRIYRKNGQLVGGAYEGKLHRGEGLGLGLGIGFGVGHGGGVGLGGGLGLPGNGGIGAGILGRGIAVTARQQAGEQSKDQQNIYTFHGLTFVVDFSLL